MARIISYKSIKNITLHILYSISFLMTQGQIGYGMETSGATSSQLPAISEDDQSTPSSAQGSHENRELKPNPQNPVRILKPNPDDESRDDRNYENPLIESGEFYKPREPLLHPREPLPVPLTEIDADRFNWSMTIVKEVNPYFSQPYADNPNDKLLCRDDSFVYRPNHSLAHGLRQAYLAVDIVVFLKNAALSQQEQEEDTPGNALRKWVITKLEADSKFLKKIEFANAFQRSGRQSDIGKDDNPDKYNEYLMNDQKNFQAAAEKRMGDLFKNQEEINLFSQAIVEKFDPGMPSSDLVFLSKILYTAHLLDLRRLPHFSKDKILKNISMQLFERDNPKGWEGNLLDKLWERSGDYLNATGDRDMDDRTKSNYDPDVFCSQAHNPELLVQALQLARAKPETKLPQSILAHTEAIRALKERSEYAGAEETPYEHTPEEQQKITELRKALEVAPYTASEGYLKILLGEGYTEILRDAPEEIAREITIKNVKAFLAEPNRIDPKNPQNLVPRVENPDDDYITALVNCLMEERKNWGKIVLYHTTEPEMGFLYDVYTQLRNQLTMVGGHDMSALRAIDKGFLQLDEEVQKEDGNRKANVRNFMKKFKGVADSDTAYRDMILSTNFSLFGSDQQINADTYNMFYLVKGKTVTTQPLKYEEFFDYIQRETGIPGDYAQYKAIMDRYALTCKNGVPCRNGRLIQIFIDPEVLVDIGYFSVLMGAPVLKNDVVPSLDKPIKLLRTEPDSLIKYLENTKGGIVNYVGSNLLRPNKLELHDLQVRLFMRPEVMFNPRLINIKSYWRFGSPEDITAYFSQIKQLVNRNLATWIEKGSPANPDAFASETVKLKKFTQEVYKGSTGSEAPSAPPLPLEDQFVSLLSDRKFDEAARMLEHSTKDLSDKIFKTLPDRSGDKGENLTLIELIARNQNLQLIKVAFDKGIFPGGDNTYKIFELIAEGGVYDAYDFLTNFNKIQDPSKTSSLYFQYFTNVPNLQIKKCYDAINFIGNDESIIKFSQPLLDLFEYFNVDSILKGIYSIPDSKRKNIIPEIISLLSYIKNLPKYSNERIEAGWFIEKIITNIFEMQNLNLSHEQRQHIWSAAQKIFPNDWYDRLELISILQQITWVADKQEYYTNRWIKAPFNAQDVINHARTKPEIYDMKFLESEIGLRVVTEIINQLNNHMIPQNDFASLSSAYNRSRPDAGYNKSLIADYVSRLKTRMRS